MGLEALVAPAGRLVDSATAEDPVQTLLDGPDLRVLLLVVRPGKEIEPHRPSSDLILAALDGSGQLLLDGAVHQLRPGDLAVVPKGRTRAIRCLEGRLVALALVSPRPGPDDHRPPPEGASWPSEGVFSDPAEVIRAEHRHLVEGLTRLEQLVGLGAELGPQELASRLRAAAAFVSDELLPHARAEEQLVYPRVEMLLRAQGGATATMALDHRRIEELAARLGRLAGAPQEELDRGQALATLSALGAVVGLHLEKEEAYLSRLHQLSPGERLELLQALGVQTVQGDETKSQRRPAAARRRQGGERWES